MKTSFAALVLLALASLALGISSQTEEIGASASEVSQLIKVSSNLSFENLIPGHSYSAQVKIEWAVPQESLANIAEKEVIVRVKIEPRVNNSWLFFQKDGVRTKVAYAQLKCIVAQGRCSQDSTLAASATAYYFAPIGAQYPHQDGLKISASLLPIGQVAAEEEIELKAIEKISSLEKQSADLGAASAGTTTGGGLAQVRQLIEDARVLVAEKKFGELTERIALLENKILQLRASPTPLPDGSEAGASNQAENSNGPANNAGAAAEEDALPVEKEKPIGAAITTGLVVNPSTAFATGGVALAILAMLAFVAVKNKRTYRQQAPKMTQIEYGENAMGSGQAMQKNYAPYSRESREESGFDKWPG